LSLIEGLLIFEKKKEKKNTKKVYIALFICPNRLTSDTILNTLN